MRRRSVLPPSVQGGAQSTLRTAPRIELFDRLGIPLGGIPKPNGEEQHTPDELRTAATRYMPRKVFIKLTAMPQDTTLYSRAREDTTQDKK